MDGKCVKHETGKDIFYKRAIRKARGCFVKRYTLSQCCTRNQQNPSVPRVLECDDFVPEETID